LYLLTMVSGSIPEISLVFLNYLMMLCTVDGKICKAFAI